MQDEISPPFVLGVIYPVLFSGDSNLVEEMWP